jgi:hypothetical protein
LEIAQFRAGTPPPAAVCCRMGQRRGRLCRRAICRSMAGRRGGLSESSRFGLCQALRRSFGPRGFGCSIEGAAGERLLRQLADGDVSPLRLPGHSGPLGRPKEGQTGCRAEASSFSRSVNGDPSRTRPLNTRATTGGSAPDLGTLPRGHAATVQFRRERFDAKREANLTFD